MAERLKVRLVRCPKCSNLLPELHDYSVYKCGGCGAFLRARKKVSLNGGVSEKLEKEKRGEDFEKLKSSSVRENGDYLDIASANENEINGDFHNKSEDIIFKQRNDDSKQPNGSSVDRMNVTNESCQADYVMNISKSVYSNESCQADYPMNRSKAVYSNESCQADYTMNRSKSVRTNRGQVSVSAEPLRQEAIRGDWDSGAHVNRMADNPSRLSRFGYPEKGSSSYQLSSSASTNGKQVKNFDDFNGNRFAHLELDRVELLRKLDELKEQICRSDSVKRAERRTYDQHIEVKNFYFPQPHANVYPQFEQVPSHGHSCGEYIDYNQEQFVPYRERSLYHGPACPCIRCCNTKQQDASEVRAVFGEKRSIANRFMLPLRDAKSDSRWPNNYFDSSIDTFHPGKAAALPSKDANLGSRWPSHYIDPNIGTFHPGKAAVSRRTVHPMTGGSPFIACNSCFEVLKLPKLGTKIQHIKIKCGACSTVLLLESKNKKLTITVREDSVAKASKKGLLRPRNVRFCTEETECSVDFNNTDDYKRQNSTKSEKEEAETATRSYISSNNKDDTSQDMDRIILTSNFSYVSEMPSKDINATKDGVVLMNSFEKNLEKNESSETEMECSSNEFDLSQDSIEVKVSENISVFVNGHPIPDHIVRKVEKLAGPIQPGDYWYDFEAGFWGVMGHPCLGIIPPFIEEFNYPMPRNCAAGNTSVFVNGRELNEQDLKLLASRGLPITEDKFYIMEISGRVYDRDTVKELYCLGKLAPTVEKLKRGFGMKVPRKLLTN
ncbi:hypothetical protein M5689_008285 [Euphorbia peplus]|nr:hypothetical protein M5689_008285 [Euphorbia peplus]